MVIINPLYHRDSQAIPSGKHTKSYGKWPSRNSWFTQLEDGRIFHRFLGQFTREYPLLPGIPMGMGWPTTGASLCRQRHHRRGRQPREAAGWADHFFAELSALQKSWIPQDLEKLEHHGFPSHWLPLKLPKIMFFFESPSPLRRENLWVGFSDTWGHGQHLCGHGIHLEKGRAQGIVSPMGARICQHLCRCLRLQFRLLLLFWVLPFHLPEQGGGSKPLMINFSGMNIHKSKLFCGNYQGFDP